MSENTKPQSLDLRLQCPECGGTALKQYHVQVRCVRLGAFGTLTEVQLHGKRATGAFEPVTSVKCVEATVLVEHEAPPRPETHIDTWYWCDECDDCWDKGWAFRLSQRNGASTVGWTKPNGGKGPDGYP